MKVTLTEADPNEILLQAEDDKQRCQALYYVGALLLTVGETETAQKAFRVCLETGVDCLELQLARYELGPQPANASQLSDGDIPQKLASLRYQMTELYEQGQHAEAIHVGRRRCARS